MSRTPDKQALSRLLVELNRAERDSNASIAAAYGAAGAGLVAILLFPEASSTIAATLLAVSAVGLMSGWVFRSLNGRLAARREPKRRRRLFDILDRCETLRHLGDKRLLIYHLVALAEYLGQDHTNVLRGPGALKCDLIELLQSLFSVDDLRAFFCLGPSGERIGACLPGPLASLLTVARSGVEEAIRLGLVDAEFFSRLKKERPLRSEEIVRVEQHWSRFWVRRSHVEEALPSSVLQQSMAVLPASSGVQSENLGQE